MRLRRLRASALLVVLGMLLAACGRSGGSSAAAGGGGGLLIWAGSGTASDTITELGRAFGTKNGVQTTVQIVPGDKLQSQFVTASQAGKAPDVVMGAHDWIGNLVQNGTIEPLQMTEDTKATFQALAVKAVTFNGQTYGLPYTMNNIVLFRNTDLVPDPPKNFEDLVATAQQLKSSGKTSEYIAYPVGPTGNPYFINPLYTSGGGYMFGTLPNGDYNPDDLGVGSGASVAAYQKIAALGEKAQGVLKRSISGDNALSLFTSGKTAFLVTGPWDLPNLAKTDLKYDISPVPAFAGGKPARPFITVDAAYVASNTKNRALAEEFVTNYWSRPDVQLALFKASQNVPASKEALKQTAKSNPYVLEIAEVGTKYGQIMPSIPAMSAVWDPLGKAEAAVIGGADPAATVQAAAKAIQAEIS